MATVTISHAGRQSVAEVATGANLLKVLQDADVSTSFPCNGNHTCGKCRVIVSGAVSPMDEQERLLLGAAADSMRLACFTTVLGDCSVTMPRSGGNEQIAVDYSADDAALEPIYSSGYGVAVDIGTTTVVGYLFRHDSKEPLGVVGEMNKQKTFGADVLSRIVYCNEHTVRPLCQIIRRQIAGICGQLCEKAGIALDEIRALCVTGNTTMLHIFAGLEPRSLAYAPFTPLSLFGDWQEFHLDGMPKTEIYLPRSISAYVGADITCSLLASGICRKTDNVLLVDIGTNGEMGLRTADGLECCSTAAGPAFEGAGISCGSSACEGAINTVAVADGHVVYTTIGDGPAQSICGSGLIDAVAALLQVGEILPKGRFREKGAASVPIGDSGLMLTRNDIAQLLLAKGAIRAGMDTLLQHCKVEYKDLDHIVFCGGFGSYIDPHSAELIGLIPPGFAGKTIAIGNAAGTGASRILQSKQLAREAMGIATKAHAVELSTDPLFKPNYVKAMRFPEQSAE